MEPAGERSDEELAASLEARAVEIETKMAEIEAAAVTAAGGIGFGKRVGEGTNIAVSYTHLDVYKRQALGCRPVSEPAWRWPVPG